MGKAKKIGIAILVLIVAAVIFIATRPDDFHVERTAQINAPPEVVFSIINDLRQWDRWSPYEKYDPDMKKTYEGPAEGPGASYAWSGNGKVGEGRMTIAESKPNELVAMKLEFTRPFQCSNRVNFKLAPSKDGTEVSWIMDGKNNFMGKAFSVIMNMDKMVGGDFERGLANLDTAAQTPKGGPEPEAKAPEDQEETPAEKP